MSSKTARQKKLGPAPFASFEDLSEDQSSPESQGYRPMPEICEEYGHGSNNNDASTSTSTAQTPTTPRIDVEQASSPSQETSGDSTPERELFSLDAGNLSASFLEGAADVDLRSSAEELRIPYSSGRHQAPGGSLLSTGSRDVSGGAKRKVSWDAGDYRQRHRDVEKQQQQHQPLERKGSGGAGGKPMADPFFFPNRDSRLSSISSSNASARRSPSPHRMRLETSFVGPKATNLPDEPEYESAESSRRPSLLTPSPWFGDGNSRSASPMSSPVSPGCIRSFMVKYATEPRSRPTSPMGWRPDAPSPTPLDRQGEASGGSSSSRWLSSPRCERRASSPHRTLVETSFCGPKSMKVPDDEALAPRGPSPQPSSIGGSLLCIQSTPFKYATEPRSRPVSPTPTGSRSFLSLTPVPPDSRRGSVPGRCPSPMMETSFCGAKQILRLDSLEQNSPAAPVKIVAPSSGLRRASESSREDSSGFTNSLRPVRYTTEPRSRPVSPGPGTMAGSSGLDSPQLSRAMRSASPHRMIVETSFVTKMAPRQDSVTNPPGTKEAESNGAVIVSTEVSIHPLPVRYATEPRSRPVSPCPPLGNHFAGTSDLERKSMRSPSRCPSPAMIETSFCGTTSGAPPADNNEDTVTIAQPTEKSNKQQQLTSTPVKYATEPRSRPVSPCPNFLSTASSASTPDPTRRSFRSPSPNRMIETSFCGVKPIPRQESLSGQQTSGSDELTADPSSDRHPELLDESEDEASDSSSIDSITEVPVTVNHFPDEQSGDLSSSCDDQAEQAAAERAESVEFVANWPEVPPAETHHHLTTFEAPDRKSASEHSSQSPLTSPNGNGYIATTEPAPVLPPPAAIENVPPSPSFSRPVRHMPKAVACPVPPKNFSPFQHQSDSSAQSSPIGSPALPRRCLVDMGSGTASPSPSSPFPSRRTSLNSVFRRDSNTNADVVGTPPTPRKASFTTSASAKSSGVTPTDDEVPGSLPPSSGKSEKKSRGVLSSFFGKMTGGKKSKDADASRQQLQLGDAAAKGSLTLPVQSRDSSPGRSAGESTQSGDDLDEEDGFRHQVLLGVPDEPGDLPSHSPKKSAKDTGAAAVVPKEELGIFHQESVEDEDELPFVPTTLPIERPIAPVITPVRVRMMSEVKTTPIERPRCSVSFGPRSITDYVNAVQPPQLPSERTKIIVSLPRLSEREESLEGPEAVAAAVSATSTPPPIKVSVGTVNWEAFTGQVLTRSLRRRKTQTKEDEEEPPKSPETSATPEATAAAVPSAASRWVNVEDLPEPIKEPKPIKVVSGVAKDRQVQPEGEDSQESREKVTSSTSDRPPLPVSDVRKDSVSSETALLREIEEPEPEEYPSPPDELEPSIQDEDMSLSHSSSLEEELGCHLDQDHSRPPGNLLSVSAPFGMDLDVHSNRSSIAVINDVPSPDEDLSISLQ